MAVRIDIDELVATAVPPREAAVDRDGELVARHLGGDARAFDELVRRYQRPIYRLALRYVKSEADAKDVTQRTFVKALGALARWRADASFRTWLYRIAINAALNHLRDRRRDERRRETQPEPTVAPADLDRGRRSAALRAAVAALPPRQRMVLELRIYDDLTFREVAELCGVSENAAKVSFHHAVTRLRERMNGPERATPGGER